MAELKDGQRQEMEGKLLFRSPLDTDGTHVCVFERLQLESSYVGDLR